MSLHGRTIKTKNGQGGTKEAPKGHVAQRAERIRGCESQDLTIQTLSSVMMTSS